MPKWQRQIKEYLTFSNKERRGVFVLLTLLAILLLLNTLLPFLIKRQPVDFSSFEQQIAMFEKRQESYRDSIANIRNKSYSPIVNDGSRLTPFEFDPNELSADQWKQIGLNDRQINAILNYLKKGGQFRVKQDLAKIYSLSEQEYRVLEPYITIKSMPESDDNRFEKQTSLNPFPFDPNLITKEQGLKMGLHEQSINSIINYREKGGQFRKNTDLKKIYTLSEIEYTALEPFINISSDSSSTSLPSIHVMVELNTADSTQLLQLPGIGPSFSARIIKYRDLLGGFYNPAQLLEVYGMDSARFLTIAGQVIVDKEKIRKININKANIKEMTKHPYIEFYVAKSIVNFRNENGTFTDIAQIRDARLIYSELFLKIEPYLSVK